jgi:hypothetical protein
LVNSGDILAVPVLSVLATAIGSSHSILLKNGFIEGPRIYGAIIAEPGGKKTPALKKATLPILERQKQLTNEYVNLKEEYNYENFEYQRMMDAWKRTKPQEHDIDDHPMEPQPPVMAQVKTSDATMEAISQLLENNPRGILFEQDELAAWVKSMNAYRSGKGADLENWLSLWSGEQITINRKSKPEPVLIFNPIVNVIGCIQPDLLEDLNGMKQNGFFDRILFSFPRTFHSSYTESDLPDHLITAYVNNINNLFTLEPGRDDFGNEIPQLLRFTQPGSHAWLSWNRKHDQEFNDPLLPYYFKGPWAKYRSYMARFILILQLAWDAEYKKLDNLLVNPESVHRAWKLIDYFKSHIRKTYNVLYSSQIDKHVESAFTWISLQGGEATLRSLQHNNIAGCKSASQVRELIEEMTERRLGTLIKSTHASAGRPMYIFRLKDPTKL